MKRTASRSGNLRFLIAFEILLIYFKNADGKRVQKWIALDLPVKGNKRRAEAMLSELLVTYQGIERVEPMNTLLSQHIAAWIEMSRPNLAVTTYDQYVNMLVSHIAPYFDARGITVSKVTAGDLEDYYKQKTREGLSPNSVIKHHAIIRSALQWAVKHRYIFQFQADFLKFRVKQTGLPFTFVKTILSCLECEKISFRGTWASRGVARRKRALAAAGTHSTDDVESKRVGLPKKAEPRKNIN